MFTRRRSGHNPINRRSGILLAVNFSPHAILAYATTALLAPVCLAAFFGKTSEKYRRIVRLLFIAGVLALPPVLTTGVLAHCRQVWAAARVEEAPPNLPWYRLTRDASRPDTQFQGAAIARHAWLGAAVTVALVLTVAGYTLSKQRPDFRTRAAGAAILSIVVLVTAATGMWIRGVGDPVPLSAAVYAHTILTGLALSAGGLVIVMCLTRHTEPARLRNAAVLAIIILFLCVGAWLFVSTGWQPRRLPALLRQPRDAAHLLAGVAAIVVLDAILWAAARQKRRWTLACAAVLAILLAAQLWLATLILYDGSHRGSEVWRFHRPFVQTPER